MGYALIAAFVDFVPNHDRIRVTDIAYIQTAEGCLYLAVVIDLLSRKVFG
jgi:transposase InsO family protein